MALVQQLVFGLVLGSYIALAAIGFTLIYGLADMINFAYGEYMTVGAYAGFIAAEWLGLGVPFLFVAGLPLPVAPILVIGVVAVAGWGLAEVFFEPLHDAGPIPLLLTSIGVGLVLRNGIRIVASPSPRSVGTGDPITFRFESLGFFVTSRQLFIIAVALLGVLAMHLFLTRTKLGVGMRATADNETLAMVTGIDADRIRRLVWVLASGFAGLAGLLLALSRSASPSTGFDQLLLVITAAILGGAGSPYGAVVGAYVLGATMSLAIAFLPSAVSELGTTMAFAVLIVVLLVKPEGIAGTEVGA